MAEFELFYTYRQIACFLSDLENPFNNWTKKHSQQGFSYREGSVSFSTLQDSNDCLVRIFVREAFTFDSQAIRIIQVPLEINETGIEIASITESFPVDILAGLYNLIFMISIENNIELYSFYFIPTSFPEVKIIKQDNDIELEGELLLDAEPAT